MSDEVVDLAASMKGLGETMLRTETRQAYVERRLMDENMLPHEGVRILLSLLAAFIVSGDIYWPLRRIRDVCLAYMRALSSRYGHMKGEGKGHLCRLMVFEAFKRRLYEVEHKPEELER